MDFSMKNHGQHLHTALRLDGSINGVPTTSSTTMPPSSSSSSPGTSQSPPSSSPRQHTPSSTQLQHSPTDGSGMLPRPSSDAKTPKQRHKDQLNELISCQICGDTSTGFHYGVHSCEGCKGFFRRSISQHTSYTCTNKEVCDISIYTRNQCQLCRWRKCCAVGMSKDASRLGRRSKRMIERMQDMITKTTTPKEDADKRMKTSEVNSMYGSEYMRHPWGTQDVYDRMTENHPKSSITQEITQGYSQYPASNYPNVANIKLENTSSASACLYEGSVSKQMPSGYKKYNENSLKSDPDGDSQSSTPMSPTSAGCISSANLSEIHGVSAKSINQMLASGQPVILIPQQIGSTASGLAIQGQIPPAVVVVKQAESENFQTCKSPEIPNHISEIVDLIHEPKKKKVPTATLR